MARTKGSASFAGTLEVLAGAPLDARDKVATKADLTAVGSFPYFWVGMETYVASENKKYRLVAADPTVAANWIEAGADSEAIIDAAVLRCKQDIIAGASEDYDTLEKIEDIMKTLRSDIDSFVPLTDKQVDDVFE